MTSQWQSSQQAMQVACCRYHHALDRLPTARDIMPDAVVTHCLVAEIRHVDVPDPEEHNRSVVCLLAAGYRVLLNCGSLIVYTEASA